MRFILGTTAFIAAITSSSVLAQVSKPLPPYQGLYQPQGVDEIGLWREDDENEKRLASSPLVIRDENLTDYVKQVLCRTVGIDRCNSVRLYIIREPSFNASMSPNGTMRVFSGLFLRVRNEAELGAMLGHEFGHFESRHTLKLYKAKRSGTDLLAWSALLASMSRSYSVHSNFQELDFAVYGNLFRHSRDQEREADLLGLAYLNRSDLPPQGAGAVWHTIMAEGEASAKARGLKRPNFKAIAFTASHPPEEERQNYLSKFADAAGASRDDGSARYRKALSPWLGEFLEDQVKLNDFGASDFLIENIAEAGWNSDLWFARGELYRLRGSQRDYVNAIDFYHHAIDEAPNHALAYRGLGLSMIKTGRLSEGRIALSEYLRLKPEASDAKMIKLLLPGEQAK
jgi:beta-barrel assembly-enhancing protease